MYERQWGDYKGENTEKGDWECMVLRTVGGALRAHTLLGDTPSGVV